MEGAWPCVLAVELDRLAQRPRQRLEAALGDVVGVVAVEGLQVHAGAAVHGEGVVEFLEQLGVHLADLGRANVDLPDQDRAGSTGPRAASVSVSSIGI